MTQDTTPDPTCTVLPDGSAFAVASWPLSKDHWLYAARGEWDSARDEYAECPLPILTQAQVQAVTAAARYAIRGATMCGQEQDFDPDALVLNLCYALCGPAGGAALAQPQQAAPEFARLEALIAERDALRHALEVIAVGDSADPVRDAGDELVALGHWRAEALEASRAAPAGQAAAWEYWHPREDRYDGPDLVRRKAVSYFTEDTRRAWVAEGWHFEPLFYAPKQAPAAEAVQPALAVRLTDEQIDSALMSEPSAGSALMQPDMTVGTFRQALRILARAVERAVWEANNLRGVAMDREKLLQNPLPIDRVAARVVKPAKPEEVWMPKPRPLENHAESGEVLPIGPLPKTAPRDILRVVGQRRGRMVVIGYAAQQGSQNKNGRWVVRCDCGRYEHRTSILRWLGTKDNDWCRECQHRHYRIKKFVPDKPKAERATAPTEAPQ